VVVFRFVGDHILFPQPDIADDNSLIAAELHDGNEYNMAFLHKPILSLVCNLSTTLVGQVTNKIEHGTYMYCTRKAWKFFCA